MGRKSLREKGRSSEGIGKFIRNCYETKNDYEISEGQKLKKIAKFEFSNSGKPGKSQNYFSELQMVPEDS